MEFIIRRAEHQTPGADFRAIAGQQGEGMPNRVKLDTKSKGPLVPGDSGFGIF